MVMVLENISRNISKQWLNAMVKCHKICVEIKLFCPEKYHKVSVEISFSNALLKSIRKYI